MKGPVPEIIGALIAIGFEVSKSKVLKGIKNSYLPDLYAHKSLIVLKLFSKVSGFIFLKEWVPTHFEVPVYWVFDVNTPSLL